ncbi:MAG: hypothetical protein ACM3YM_08735 [Sphingomonadales bacterium]
MTRYLAAAALSVAPIQARAAELASLDKEELTAVLMAPPFIEGASERCSSFLPAGAFLRTGCAGLAARLTREANIPSGRLMAVSTRIAGKAPGPLSGATMAMVSHDVVKSEPASKLKASDRAAFNQIAEAIAPLPAANVAQLIGAIMVLAPDTGNKTGLHVCRADARG